METGSRDGSRPVPASVRFRRSYGRTVAGGIVLSVVLHLFLLLVLSPAATGGVDVDSTEPRLVILPPEQRLPQSSPERPSSVRLPPPPAEILRPAPPRPVHGIDPDEPVLVPHDIPPRLVNVDEVRAILEAGFAPTSDGPAAEPLVVLWLYVDRAGDVRKLQLRRSSGRSLLDRLAQDAARAMKFRPALYKGRTVAVWIMQPIRFRTELADGAP